MSLGNIPYKRIPFLFFLLTIHLAGAQKRKDQQGMKKVIPFYAEIKYFKKPLTGKDKSEKLLKKEIYKRDGSLSEVILYTDGLPSGKQMHQSGNGKTTCVWHYNAQGTLILVEFSIRNNCQHFVKTKRIEATTEGCSEINEKYNEQNLLTGVERVDQVQRAESLFEYGKKGYSRTEYSTIRSKIHAPLEMKQVTRYNREKDIIAQTGHNLETGKKDLEIYYTNYVYDNFGHWISRMLYERGDREFMEKREIRYYRKDELEIEPQRSILVVPKMKYHILKTDTMATEEQQRSDRRSFDYSTTWLSCHRMDEASTGRATMIQKVVYLSGETKRTEFDSLQNITLTSNGTSLYRYTYQTYNGQVREYLEQNGENEGKRFIYNDCLEAYVCTTDSANEYRFYNTRGNLYKILRFFNSGAIQETDWVFNETGNLLEVYQQSYVWVKGEEGPAIEYSTSTITYNYDEAGQCMQEMRIEDHNGTLKTDVIRYSNYKSDEKGNWLERDLHGTGGQFIKTQVRKIQYY